SPATDGVTCGSSPVPDQRQLDGGRWWTCPRGGQATLRRSLLTLSLSGVTAGRGHRLEPAQDGRATGRGEGGRDGRSFTALPAERQPGIGCRSGRGPGRAQRALPGRPADARGV